MRKIQPDIAQINTNLAINPTIQVGTYEFINCMPLNSIFEEDTNFVLSPVIGTPADLNKLLLSDKLFIGPISSVDFIQNKEKFILLNNISISSQKEVGSVVLFSNKEFNKLNNSNIALTVTSSTSSNLLKLLLTMNHQKNISYNFHNYEKPLKSLLNTYDACLFIGDPALIALNTPKIDTILTYDLAHLWFQLTGLPFVFCVWVANKKWALNNATTKDYINEKLLQSKNKALKDSFQEIVMKSSQLSNLNTKILVKYFKDQLSYNFTEKHNKALALFEILLANHKII